jgi:hypothetical protein
LQLSLEQAGAHPNGEASAPIFGEKMHRSAGVLCRDLVSILRRPALGQFVTFHL